MVELLRRRDLEAVHVDALRVHAAHHVADRPVLARGVERLEDDEDARRCPARRAAPGTPRAARSPARAARGRRFLDVDARLKRGSKSSASIDVRARLDPERGDEVSGSSSLPPVAASTAIMARHANICSCRATILHADADAFFASVEQRDDPAAARAAGDRRRRASCSPRATRRRPSASATAMGGRQALRLCPQAIVVPPRMAAYTEASQALYAVFEDTTPLVEGLSIDEAFLDVRGMERSAGTPLEIAARLRQRGPRAGRARRSRSASRARSSSPRSRARLRSRTGCCSCRPTARARFLHPLPVERMWGVGHATAARLREPRDRHDRRPRARARGRARGDARPRGRAAAARAREPPRPAARAHAAAAPLDRLPARAAAAGGARRRRSTPTSSRSSSG